MKKQQAAIAVLFLIAAAASVSPGVASGKVDHLLSQSNSPVPFAAQGASAVAAVASQPATPSPSPSVAPPLKAMGRPALVRASGNATSAPLHGQRGITVSAFDDPAFATKASAFLDHVAALGVNSLNVVVWFRQSTYTSSDPHLSPGTASPPELQIFITYAHQRGMSVIIRPLMDDGNLAPQWRGTVLPADPATWFANYYSAVIRPYATLSGVDAVDIGSEMATLADKMPDRWLSLISTLRSVLPGVRLTYSSTDWISLPGEQQPYPTFAESLDLIGVDAFFPLQGVTNGYDIGQLVNAWQPALAKVNRLATYYHKPVLFTELGLASECCTLSSPFVWNSTAAPNLQAQAAYYAAACRAIRPWRIGLYWWDYNGLDPLPSPSTDNGFSPYGKPAEQEMARCYQSGY